MAQVSNDAVLLCTIESAFCWNFGACGLFSFFTILLSNSTCPTTLQVHLGQEQIIRILAGDTAWLKPGAVWTLGTFWRSQRCSVSWQPKPGTSELEKILLESSTPIKLGHGKSHDRVKGYFEQFFRFWVIKHLWWEEKMGSMSHKMFFDTVVC